MPLMGRDFAFKAYAADCMNEHGRIIISGKYIEEYPEKPIPFKKSGWLQDKMRIIELKNIINVINPKSAQVSHTSIGSPDFLNPILLV